MNPYPFLAHGGKFLDSDPTPLPRCIKGLFDPEIPFTKHLYMTCYTAIFDYISKNHWKREHHVTFLFLYFTYALRDLTQRVLDRCPYPAIAIVWPFLDILSRIRIIQTCKDCHAQGQRILQPLGFLRTLYRTTWFRVGIFGNLDTSELARYMHGLGISSCEGVLRTLNYGVFHGRYPLPENHDPAIPDYCYAPPLLDKWPWINHFTADDPYAESSPSKKRNMQDETRSSKRTKISD